MNVWQSHIHQCRRPVRIHKTWSSADNEMSEVQSVEWDESRNVSSGVNIMEVGANYFDALMKLNRKLCGAKNRSEVASCYGRRSEVYFAMGQYQKCLKNLQLSKEWSDDSPAMTQMETECVKLLASESDHRDLDFFKLSFPPNESNPSFVNCVKLCVSDEYGRHLVTTRRLKSGDIVAIEQPFYKSLDKDGGQGRCVNCFKTNLLDLIPCASCTSVMFCSKECEKMSWERFHKYECSSIDDLTQDDGFLMMIQRSLFKAMHICDNLQGLEKLVEEHLAPTNAFDLKTNANCDDLEKQKLLVCQSLEAAAANRMDEKFAGSFVRNHEHVKRLWKTDEQRDFLIAFVVNLIGILYRNAFTMHWSSPSNEVEHSGCALFPSMSLVNHSCSPNLFRILVDENLVFIVRKPIEENEQLFISYQWVCWSQIKNYLQTTRFIYSQLFLQSPTEDRRKSLQNQFNFICRCTACEENYPLVDDLARFDSHFEEPSDYFDSFAEAIEAFNLNCEYIDKNVGHYPCYEIARLMQSNCNILLTIASNKFVYEK